MVGKNKKMNEKIKISKLVKNELKKLPTIKTPTTQ